MDYTTGMEYVVLDSQDFNKISKIISRMYDAKKMSYDERREIAATLSAVAENHIGFDEIQDIEWRMK
jgi:hypothetical protein